jgi:RNA polymerase sigma factor (sigma-70 family)
MAAQRAVCERQGEGSLGDDGERRMSESDGVLPELQEARQRFLQLVAELRPELHRYCARMTGSIADGEDVVQDTLARAYYELSALKQLPAMRSWLFRIAHHRALDYLKRYDRRMGEPLEEMEGFLIDKEAEAEAVLAREQAVHAAVSRFLELAPAQRSCVILKDVLDHSLEDISRLLGLTLPATKAALHRGRTRLRELSQDSPAPARPQPHSPALLKYAALFNARDWDGVRAMLLDAVQLDVVSIHRRVGRDEVGTYFNNYARLRDWRLVPAWLDGREVLAVFRGEPDARPAYFIEIATRAGSVAAIRDFFHVPYIAREASFDLDAALRRKPP